MEMNIALLSNARVVHSLYLQYTEGRETGLSPQLAQRILHGRSQFWASLGESLKPWNRFDISILCGELAGNAHNCITRVIQGFADNCAAAWVFTEWVETLQRLERLGAHIWVKVPGRVYHQLERVAIIELCAGTNGRRIDDAGWNIGITRRKIISAPGASRPCIDRYHPVHQLEHCTHHAVLAQLNQRVADLPQAHRLLTVSHRGHAIQPCQQHSRGPSLVQFFQHLQAWHECLCLVRQSF